MPVSASWPTGKRNMLASVIDYLVAQLPSGTVITGEPYLQAPSFPAVSIQDAGLFGFEDQAFDDLLHDDGAGTRVRGKQEQTQLEITIADKATVDNTKAVQNVRILYDQVKQAFELSGLTLPPIKVYDYSQAGKPDTGAIAWHPTELGTGWLPQFIKDDGNPTVWRYRIYVRIYWEQYRP